MNRILPLFAAMLVVACSDVGETPSQNEAPPSPTSPIGELPPPLDYESLDPAAAQQFRERWAFAERVLAQTDNPSGVAWALGDLGRLFHAYQESDPARDLYEQSRRLDPEEPRWPYYIASLYRQTDPERAAKEYEAVLKLRPDHVPSLVWLGDANLDRGRLEEAEALYRKALGARPDCVKAHVGFGRIALERDDAEAALRHFSDAEALQAEATAILHGLGTVHRRLGDLESASSYFQRIPANDQARVAERFDDPWMQEVYDLRRSAQHHARLGMRAVARKNWRVAVREFTAALEIDPSRADARHNLAGALLRLQRREEAVEHLEEAVRRSPEYARSMILLARLRAEDGQKEKAATLLQEALRIDPDSEAARRELERLGDGP